MVNLCSKVTYASLNSEQYSNNDVAMIKYSEYLFSSVDSGLQRGTDFFVALSENEVSFNKNYSEYSSENELYQFLLQHVQSLNDGQIKENVNCNVNESIIDGVKHIFSVCMLADDYIESGDSYVHGCEIVTNS